MIILRNKRELRKIENLSTRKPDTSVSDLRHRLNEVRCSWRGGYTTFTDADIVLFDIVEVNGIRNFNFGV